MRLDDISYPTPSEAKVLAALRKSPGCTVADIRERASMTYSTVQNTVKDLTDRGWLRRKKMGRTYYYWETLREDEILSIPGIVVRKLPTVVVSRWRHYVQHHGEPRNTETRKVIEGPNETGLYIVEERKPVSEELSGKFMVTVVSDTGATIVFNKDRNGIGDTIPEAYQDLLQKQGARNA